MIPRDSELTAEYNPELLNGVVEITGNVKYNNGGGQSGYKRNDSVGELNKTNAQMLKLLNELGIKATVADSGDDDEL